jgi:hypothetical protein
MSTTLDYIAGLHSLGETIEGDFVNIGLKDFDSLEGWTAKFSLLREPTLSPTVDALNAVLDIDNFDNTTGRVPVSFALIDVLPTLPQGIPAGTYRARWHLFDANGVELAGPTPKPEQTFCRFSP